MLFTRDVLAGIADGTVTLAFRRWERPRTVPGGRQRTPIGVVAIDAVDEVAVEAITDEDARRAGFASRTALVSFLSRHPTGQVYRIAVRLAGADPRVALREQDRLTGEELVAIIARLDRLDRASRHGAWTRQVLELVGAQPATRAPDLAAHMERETQPFKHDVRKLKELGLTESLPVGYRLSPRGKAVLAAIRQSR